MKKAILKATVSLLTMIFFLSSCKEIHKMNKEAENEADAEIRSEKLDKEIKMLEAVSAKLPKTESEIRYEGSKKQQTQMNNDKSIIFSKNKDIGFKYTEIKKIKINGNDDDSDINLKYKIYLKTKELNGDGVINYKVNFSPYYASGMIIKKQ